MMSIERFRYGETDLFEWVEDNGEIISTKECVDKLNEQQSTIKQLQEENKYLKKRFEAISQELYCKDRKLEELGVPIECCDTDE